MASLVWQIRGVDTGGNDLALSRMVPWADGAAVTVVSIESSVPPKAGGLGDLLIDDAAVCVFDAAAVAAPGFSITLTLSASVDLWGVRFAGPSKDQWPLRHTLLAGAQACALGAVLWSSDGLSPAPTSVLLMGRVLNAWVDVSAAAVNGLAAVAASNNGQVLLRVEAGGYPWISRNGGVSWTRYTAPGARSWVSCDISASGQTIVLAGSYTSVYLSKNAGVSWAAQSAPGNRDWRACRISDDGQTILACASDGYVYLSKNAGASWVLQPSLLSLHAWSSCAVSGDGQVLLVSGANALLISTDAGGSWQTVDITLDSYVSWASVAASHNGHVLLCATTSSEVFLSSDRGETWSVNRQLTGSGFVRAACSGGGNHLVLMDSVGEVHESKNAGGAWAVHRFAVRVSDAFLSRDGSTLLAGGSSGFLRQRARGDAVYQESDLRFSGAPFLHPSRGVAVVRNAGPLFKGPTLSYGDIEFGGRGRIFGSVAKKTEVANAPLARRVRLHRSRDGYLVRETWSRAEDGYYEFSEINAAYEYDVTAHDHEGHFRSEIGNNLTPEVMP